MKSFLKWAGGKSRVLPNIQSVLPQGKRLIEPFAGSGVVFLNSDYPEFLLADSNADLINLFNQLKIENEGFIKYAKTLFIPENNTEESFYALRKTFNKTSDVREKSAIFIYLNRHCFNGLCRYNSKGGFNVPYGRYSNPGFPEAEMLGFLEKAPLAEFMPSDFVKTMEMAELGDVVYCDPPYAPLEQKSNFTSYAAGGFGVNEQLKLAEMALKLQSRGITVVISNHNTEFTQAAYKGAEIHEFDVQRNIAADGMNRKKAKELLAVFA
jgi:DNA adenine methylase